MVPLLSEAQLELQARFSGRRQGSKVFCIGYPKTGTTSVGEALRLLGYRHTTFNRTVWRRYYEAGKIERVLAYAARYESFDDLPWSREDLIPVLDRTFPRSKFIYLERDEQAWKQSYVGWNASELDRPVDPEEGWRAYLEHRRWVRSYFADRPEEDLLVLRVADPDGFHKLGNFLGRPAPGRQLPKLNARST